MPEASVRSTCCDSLAGGSLRTAAIDGDGDFILAFTTRSR
jgi:hypothetical protein